MLRHENPRTGLGNTAEQEAFRKEFQRDGVRDIHLGYLQRDLLQMVYLPRWKKKSHRGERPRYSKSQLKPITHHSDVEVAMMWDRALPEVRPGGRKIATVATVMQPRMSSAGQAFVAPARGKSSSLWVDFAVPQFQPQQKSCVGRNIGELKANLWQRPSKLLIRNFGGESLDICIGFLRRDVPAINYRISLEHFQGDDPRAVLCQGEIPGTDQCVEVGVVEPGTPLVILRKPTSYEEAITKDGRPDVFRGYPPVTLSLDDPYHVHLFGQFNEMNKLMNDMTLEEDTPTPEDPENWAPQALVEFAPDVAKRLTTLSLFQPTTALVEDLLWALRPGSEFLDNSKLEEYVGVSIEPGAYSWETLSEQLGSRLPLLLDVFLQTKAVMPEESGVSGVLLPAQYVLSVLDYARKERRGVTWYWDFRSTWHYLDRGVLFCMPMRYRGAKDMKLGGIQYSIETPQRTRPKSNRQHRAKLESDVKAHPVG